MNVEIKTPSETTRFWNIWTPAVVKGMSLSSSWKQNLLSSVCTRHFTATCEVTPDRVKTFTGKTIEVSVESVRLSFLRSFLSFCSVYDVIRVTCAIEKRALGMNKCLHYIA